MGKKTTRPAPLAVLHRAADAGSATNDGTRSRASDQTGARGGASRAVAALPCAADGKSTLVECFADLSGLRRVLANAAEQRELARLDALRRAEQAAADADMFRRAVGPVVPLDTPERLLAHPPRPRPLPLKTRLDEREVLREALSDTYDPDVLFESDDSLSFKRNGVGREVVRKLRRGGWVVQAQIDLHGLRSDEARDAMAQFIRDAAKRGLRCVRVIHGKGLGSLNREPVLKGKVRAWLTQKSEVMAFCEALDRDGGAGAVLVLLQAQRHF